MDWLEPSAGIGSIADHMPDDAHVTCYEISQIHCEVLKAKGYQRVGPPRQMACLDFLELANEYRGGGYDRVVMNPPYSQGRWQEHLMAAAHVTKKSGRLVAILPASAQGLPLLPEWDMNWSHIYTNEFKGTSVSVVILTAERPEYQTQSPE
jgi:tRNA1(Val) A37 N6-methylase TrmN6